MWNRGCKKDLFARTEHDRTYLHGEDKPLAHLAPKLCFHLSQDVFDGLGQSAMSAMKS